MGTELSVDLPIKFVYDEVKSKEENWGELDRYLDSLSRSVEEMLKRSYSRLSDVADSPTEDDIATVDEDGNVVDSSKAFDTDGTLAGNSNNSIPTEKAVKTYVDALIPSGLIAIWHGTLANVPSGWVLCDGDNSTPDLRDKFVRGAANAADPGTTSGADTHTTPSHTLLTAEIPSHSHATAWQMYTEAGGQDNSMADGGTTPSYDFTLSTETTGGGGGHTHTAANNVPAYYAVAFIMKT